MDNHFREVLALSHLFSIPSRNCKRVQLSQAEADITAYSDVLPFRKTIHQAVRRWSPGSSQMPTRQRHHHQENFDRDPIDNAVVTVVSICGHRLRTLYLSGRAIIFIAAAMLLRCQTG